MQLQRGPELTPFDNIDINGVFDLSDCGIDYDVRTFTGALVHDSLVVGPRLTRRPK